MFAQYSPLFTSGLMSDSPVSSRTPSPSHALQQSANHDSLPVTVKSSATTSFYYDSVRSARSSNTGDEGLLFTLAPHRRQVDEGRSFLSLDLAESQSMRSMSLRRKDTVTTKASASFGRSEPSSPYASPISPYTKRSPFAPLLPPISPSVSSMSASQSLRRPSRETLRLPSPKPVPSINLPEPPSSAPATLKTQAQSQSRRRRPSDLVLTLSACFTEAGSSSCSSSPSPFAPQHRPSHSAPSLVSPPILTSPIDGSSYFMFSPTSPSTHQSFPLPSPPPPTASSAYGSFPDEPVHPHSAVSLKASPSTRSTATVNTRNRNRSAALAALEGRSPRSLSAVREDKRRSGPKNFMSMSDDEDDEMEGEDDPETEIRDVRMQLFSVLNEEEGLVIPQPELVSSRTSKRSSVGAKRGRTAEKDNEQERDMTTSRRDSGVRTSSTPSSKRSRRSTIESFFSPLTNFIDFREDEGTRGWRSFVEISS